MLELTPDDFSGMRLKRKGNACALFYARWCPFCMGFKPVFDALKCRKDVEMACADLSDEDNPLWDAFGIEVVPVLMVFSDGELVWRRDSEHMQGMGEIDVSELLKALKAL